MAALPLIVFDVNETLLDLQSMEPTFERIFGEKAAMRLCFANFIMYSAAENRSSPGTRNRSLTAMPSYVDTFYVGNMKGVGRIYKQT